YGEGDALASGASWGKPHGGTVLCHPHLPPLGLRQAALAPPQRGRWGRLRNRLELEPIGVLVQYPGGRRVCQSVACWYACATLSNSASDPGPPASCIPMGRPSAV